MIIDRHSLAIELPEFKDKIHELKMNSAHFTKLNDRYTQLDHEIIRMEEGIETVSDEVLNEKRKQRLALKDELFALLHSQN